MNEVHFDFAFLGKEDEPGKLTPMLVIRERITSMTMASTMPTKSAGAFLGEIGCEFGDLLAKSDQEPAVMAIVKEVAGVRALQGGGQFVIENSLVGSQASNRIVERAIQSVAAQTRVMLEALEAKWKLDIPHCHPVIGFLVEYAAFLLNRRYEVGKDGRTSSERCKGKRARIVGIEFGESVMWKKTFGGGALGKLSSS